MTQTPHARCHGFKENVSLKNILQSYTRTKAPHTECRVEWLFKCGLDLVQKTHAIRDTVKCQCSCCMVQVHANTRRHRSCDVCAFVVVHKREFGVRAVQTPGLVIPAEAAFIGIPFTTDSSVGNSHIYLCSLPVHLPVATSPNHTIPAQHLEEKEWNESLKGMISQTIEITFFP